MIRTLGHEAEKGRVAGKGKRGRDKEGQPKAAQLSAISTHHRPDDPTYAQYRLLHIRNYCVGFFATTKPPSSALIIG